jgi:hypothetical protein
MPAIAGQWNLFPSFVTTLTPAESHRKTFRIVSANVWQGSALKPGGKFALLGTTFGGDGVQTYGLPDYRGRMPVGMGNGPNLAPIGQGEISGAENDVP